jgi:hypothetical protein
MARIADTEEMLTIEPPFVAWVDGVDANPEARELESGVPRHRRDRGRRRCAPVSEPRVPCLSFVAMNYASANRSLFFERTGDHHG